MNLIEYREKISEINASANKEKRIAAKEYALSNNYVKVGDIVEDHIGMVLVESIKIYISDPPQCVYTGRELTKARKHRKDGKIRDAFQQNLVTCNDTQ